MQPARSRLLTAATLALAMILAAPATGQQEAVEQNEVPEPPFYFAANAFALGAAIQGTSRVEISITRWSTPEEGTQLETTFLERGQEALVDALQKLPEVGRVRVGTSLSYPLQYAEANRLDDGWHVFVATDREIGPYEGYYRERTMDFPLTLIELHLNDEGKGNGTAAIGVRLRFDAETSTLNIEEWDTQPVRLRNIRPMKAP